MRKYVGLLLLMAGLVSPTWAANEPIHRLEVGGTQVWRIDEEGDVTNLGDITVGDDLTVTDDLVVTDTLSMSGGLGLFSRTLAQMNALAPGAAGQLIYVSDGLQSKICVSTGTTAGAWVVASATSTAVIGGLVGHCQ